MRFFFRQAGAVLRKDIVAEIRDLDHLLSVFLFGFLTILLFSFALSVEPELVRKMAAGIFWLAILFSSVLNLQHSFQRETENGQWEGLILLGISPQALYLGKMLANLALILLLQTVLLPIMTILFDLSLTPALVFVLVLGSFGIASLGTCYSGITAALRGGQVLLPLLLFPMLVPLLLASITVTRLLLAHDLFGQEVVWLKLLILFDTIFFLGSLLLAEALFEPI